MNLEIPKFPFSYMTFFRKEYSGIFLHRSFVNQAYVAASINANGECVPKVSLAVVTR